MRKRHTTTYLEITASILLIMTAPTFSLPKEFYDDHDGVGYDIFCRNYDAIHFDTIVKEIGIPEQQKIIYEKIEALTPYIFQYIEQQTCRGPPIIRTLTV